MQRLHVRIDGFLREVVVVGHTGGGAVVRPVDAESIRELAWLEPDPRAERTGEAQTAQPLVTGPSFLTLLEAFPEGELPVDTAAAILEALAPPRYGSASLQRLRFDLDDAVFRWSAGPESMRATEHTPWHTGLVARLLGRKGPSFERVFITRPKAPTLDLAGADVDAGRTHLAGIVAATLGHRLARDRERREHWWMHEGEVRAARDANVWKAERLFVEAEHDALTGRRAAARMAATQASIYDPNRERYRRALRAMEPRA